MIDSPAAVVVDSSGSFVAVSNGRDGTRRLHVDAEVNLDNQIVVNTNDRFCVSYEKWQSSIEVPSSHFSDIYVSYASSGSALAESIYQINTDKMYFRVVVDGVVRLDLDLEELKKDFKLDGHGHDNDGNIIGLQEYHSKKWRFAPSFPISFNDNIRLQMKSKSGCKKVERGISVLRYDA